MTLLLILAACDRSPSSDKSGEITDERSGADLEGEIFQVSRSGRLPLVFRRYFRDADGDGFGAPGSGLLANRQPVGYTRLAGDCDDADATVYPGAGCPGRDTGDTGTDTGVDTGSSDSGADTSAGDTGVDTAADTGSETSDTGDTSVSRTDADGDGWYAEEDDCNDSDPAVNPAASETGNRTDDNCDGSTDEGLGLVVSYSGGTGTIWAWYGSGGSASATVASSVDYLVFSPSTADYADHPWVDLQADLGGGTWSSGCSDFTVTSADWTTALYYDPTGSDQHCLIVLNGGSLSGSRTSYVEYVAP